MNLKQLKKLNKEGRRLKEQGSKRKIEKINSYFQDKNKKFFKKNKEKLIKLTMILLEKKNLLKSKKQVALQLWIVERKTPILLLVLIKEHKVINQRKNCNMIIQRLVVQTMKN